MRMTLDELINAMEPQARKDKALISKCVDGLTEYAAELRQKAGDAGKEQISALRRLVDELAGYGAVSCRAFQLGLCCIGNRYIEKYACRCWYGGHTSCRRNRHNKASL